jgi:hypothetical protein
MKINIKKKVKRFIFITGHFLILNDKLYEDFFFKWSKHFGFMSENFRKIGQEMTSVYFFEKL